jgi:hypothetical protein
VSSEHIPISLQRRVRERAGDRCEYCRLAQVAQEGTFHVDHVVPRRSGGETALPNLALACVSCSLRKGAAMEAIDPETGAKVPLFNPRTDAWITHFEVVADFRLAGLTPTGRATLQRLQMNRVLVVAIRAEETARGRFH